VQPHALTLPCPHRRPALKEIKRSELLNVTSIEQVSGAALSLAELSAVFCIMPKLEPASASGQKPTLQSDRRMSALPAKSGH